MRAPEQRLEALQLANQVRSQRAAWKREIRSLDRAEGLIAVAALLKDEPPPWAAALTVRSVLATITYYGDTAVAKILFATNVDGSTTLSRLTSGRRVALVDQLLNRADEAIYKRLRKEPVAEGRSDRQEHPGEPDEPPVHG